jgi:hypothetical protein
MRTHSALGIVFFILQITSCVLASGESASPIS